MNSTYQNIKTTGSIHNYDDAGQKSIDWTGEIDGINGTIKISSNDNGKKTTETINLGRDEIEELLNQKMDFIPLHDRLLRDFMSGQEYKSPFGNLKDSIHVAKKRLNRKSKKRHNSKKNKTKKNKNL